MLYNVETFRLFCDRKYEALPWPYDQDFDAFLQSPQDLKHATDNVARPSLCDGSSELPNVPADLPCPCPRGTYRVAIYHDADFIYALFHVIDPAKVEDIGKHDEWNAALTLLSNDTRWQHGFWQDQDGVKPPRCSYYPHTPRRAEIEEPAFDEQQVQSHVVPWTDGKLLAWKLDRKTTIEKLGSETLQMSLGHMRWDTLECGIWGTHFIWAGRHDQMINVQLVEQPSQLLWPIVTRVDWQLDRPNDRSRFVIHWDAPFKEGETFPKLTLGDAFGVNWTSTQVRINDRLNLYDIDDQVTTDWTVLRPGVNRIEITAAAGPALRLFPEYQPGNRINNAAIPLRKLVDRTQIFFLLRKEAEARVQERNERLAKKEKLEFRRWVAHFASSLGRYYHYFDQKPEYLHVITDEADCLLQYQREDGTVAVFHMDMSDPNLARWRGGSYDAGPVGELWIVAYQLLGDEKYLAAAKKLLRAYETYRVEFNNNFATFCLWHFAAQYRLTREPLALQHGLYYLQNIAAVDLLPDGFQSGHNHYGCYGSIILDSMATFTAVLPENHPARGQLVDRCVRMANDAIKRLQPDGRFDARDRNKQGLLRLFGGLYSVPFLVEKSDVRRIDDAINHMLTMAESTWGESYWERTLENGLIRYLAHREQLLDGEKVDPFEVF